MPSESSGYNALTISVDPACVEVAVGKLWARGTLGLETLEEGARVVLTAYFARVGGELDPWVEEEMGSGVEGIEVLSIEAVEERDWLEEHRRRSVPFALGQRFWIDAREPDPRPDGGPNQAPEGRCFLRIPARRAFGTGSHETTRLVVEILETMALEGRRVLDVGCGSGILSMAALRLGARDVLALEIDPIAALLAGRNRLLNDSAFRLLAGPIEALADRPAFDLALVNVIPEHIAPDLGGIARRLERHSRAVFSGCLVEAASDYRSALERHGFRSEQERDLGEWRAFVTRKVVG